MTDYQPPDRTQAFARAVAADIGLRPHRVAGRLERLFAILNIWFWVLVGLPTLIAGVYYFAIAADLYSSEARFLIRGSKGMSIPSLGSLVGSTGLTGGAGGDENSAAVADFIMSRDAVRKLEKGDDLRAIFSRPEADFVTRFPGLRRRNDFEALYRHYGRFVSVATGASGIETLLVKAYRPLDAQRVAQALLGYSEALVNQLNQRARRDTLALARHEVDLAEAKIAGVQTELTAYRVKEAMLDPQSASASILRLIGQMEAAQANARTQLAELLKNAPHNPQIPMVRNRIASLDTLLAEERGKLTGPGSSIASALSEYERLTVQQRLAERALASAFVSLEAARLEAQRQQLYLEVIAQPNLADYPLYPRRIWSFGLVLGSCLLAYGIAWLLVDGVREHAAA